ncbi:hypothetical protein [Sporosarcina globispora]
MDWTIRVGFLVILLIGYALNITRDPLEWFTVVSPDYFYRYVRNS